MKIYIIADVTQKAAEISRAKSLGASLALASMDGDAATAIHVLRPEPRPKLYALGCAPMHSRFHRPTLFSAVGMQQTQQMLEGNFQVELVS